MTKSNGHEKIDGIMSVHLVNKHHQSLKIYPNCRIRLWTNQNYLVKRSDSTHKLTFWYMLKQICQYNWRIIIKIKDPENLEITDLELL
jgi:hypothetical protein